MSIPAGCHWDLLKKNPTLMGLHPSRYVLIKPKLLIEYFYLPQGRGILSKAWPLLEHTYLDVDPLKSGFLKKCSEKVCILTLGFMSE